MTRDRLSVADAMQYVVDCEPLTWRFHTAYRNDECRQIYEKAKLVRVEQLLTDIIKQEPRKGLFAFTRMRG